MQAEVQTTADPDVRQQYIQAFRYELDPTPEQRVLLAKHAGARRFVWNWALAARIQWWEANKDDPARPKTPNAQSQNKEIVRLKKTELPWLSEVSKCAPQSALRDLDLAFVRFFRRANRGNAPGFPRFKKKGVCRDSFRLEGRCIRSESDAIRLPYFGCIHTKESTHKLSGRVLNATVSREADRWFVSLCVERERPTPTQAQGPAVGVDLGLTTFATISDGVTTESVDAPKPLKAKLKLLARRQRQHAKKQKGSKNREKSRMALARLHWRIKNVRLDFLKKLTTRLAKTKSVVVVEDLNVDGMKTRYGRSVSDVGFAEFRRQLAYKTQWYGSRLVVADRFFASSKLCSVCGWKNETLALSERVWTCGGCGAVHDRDENAAKNLVRLATDPTAGSAGSHACGEVHAGPESTSVGEGRRPRRSRKTHALREDGTVAQHANRLKRS